MTTVTGLTDKLKIDIRLEKVDSTGLPKNRQLWCYKIKINVKTKQLCLTVPGSIPVSNPADFDGQKSTDNEDWRWVKPKALGKKKREKKTMLCWKAKDNKSTISPTKEIQGGEEVLVPAEIKLFFIGPASGNPGTAAVSASVVAKVKDSNKVTCPTISGMAADLELPVAFSASPNTGDLLVGQPETASLDDVGLQVGVVDSDPNDDVDLDLLLTPEVAAQELDQIEDAPIVSILDLDEGRARDLGELFRVETLGQLLRDETVSKLITLSRGLSV